MKRIIPYSIALSLFLSTWIALGQEVNNGVIQGRVYNAKNNEPVPFANIVVWGTNIGVSADFDGNFTFTGLTPGFTELRVSSVGFKTYISSAIMVTNAKKTYLEIPLEETSVALDEVVVKASPFRKKEESPVSLRRIGIDEIEKNPGGNRDISKVIQSFPGVAPTVSYRNDLIVRGGGSNENRFYLDGVEIPYLNHFSTQGASGGPVGIINVDFIREVDFYSGSFPANRGNALSSIFDFKQVEGNKEKLKFRATIGASDLALTMDGPLSQNTSLVFSVRRSYLQFLFQALELPFLPTYNDVQFKVKTRINEKNEISFIGLGALDLFDLNLKANNTEEQRYILNYVPVNEQWSYTLGTVYKHYKKNGYDVFVLSRSHLNNSAYKYQENIEVDSLKILDYDSYESENKFRYEHNSSFSNEMKINYGLDLGYAQYMNNTFRKDFVNNAPVTLNYKSILNLYYWGIFGQVSKSFFENRLSASFGLRADANSYSSSMHQMYKHVSPRLSLSYGITPRTSLNVNTGRFYQRPPYTTLGYRNSDNELVNKTNGVTYIQSDHLVAGFEILPGENSQISVEGFYKKYSDYPFSVNDSVAISSKSADFGTFGDEEVLPIGKGRAYGMEILGRHKNLWGFNLIFSYTFVRSEFKDIAGIYIPTSWDNRHILNITATRSFPHHWDAGFKWRFVGGGPYTPYDYEKSSLIEAWNVNSRGYLDYSQFNQARLEPFHQLDIRVDKQYFFNRWSLMLYLDIQNIYNFKADQPANLVRVEDNEGNPVIDPDDPARYLLKELESPGGTILPTIGILIEF